MQRVPLEPGMDKALESLMELMGRNSDSATVILGPQSTFFENHLVGLPDETVAHASDLMLTGEGAKKLAEMGPLESDNDPRIREFIPEEITPIREYIDCLDRIRVIDQVCCMNFHE